MTSKILMIVKVVLCKSCLKLNSVQQVLKPLMRRPVDVQFCILSYILTSFSGADCDITSSTEGDVLSPVKGESC